VTIVKPARFCSAAAGEADMLIKTVGAPHIWVTPASRIRRKISGGSTRLRQICATDRGDTPGEAPAVAVEHGQRPEVVALIVQSDFQGLSQSIEVAPGMVLDPGCR
jgi:hypothetical protein